MKPLKIGCGSSIISIHCDVPRGLESSKCNKNSSSLIRRSVLTKDLYLLVNTVYTDGTGCVIPL